MKIGVVFLSLILSLPAIARQFESILSINNNEMRDPGYVARKIQAELKNSRCDQPTVVVQKEHESMPVQTYQVTSEFCKVVEKEKICGPGFDSVTLAGYGGEKYKVCRKVKQAAK